MNFDESKWKCYVNKYRSNFEIQEICFSKKYDLISWLKEMKVDISGSTYIMNILGNTSCSECVNVLRDRTFFFDDWFNGVLLSELIAEILLKNDKLSVKETNLCEGRIFGKQVKTRFLIIGTESFIRSYAQIVKNFDICLKILLKMTSFKHIDFIIDDFYYEGSMKSDSIWFIIHEIYLWFSNKSVFKIKKKPFTVIVDEKHSEKQSGIFNQMQTKYQQLPEISEEFNQMRDHHIDVKLQQSAIFNTPNIKTLSTDERIFKTSVSKKQKSFQSTIKLNGDSFNIKHSSSLNDVTDETILKNYESRRQRFIELGLHNKKAPTWIPPEISADEIKRIRMLPSVSDSDLKVRKWLDEIGLLHPNKGFYKQNSCTKGLDISKMYK